MTATFNITLRNIWIPILILSRLFFNIEVTLDIIFKTMICSELIAIIYNFINNHISGINPKKIYLFDKNLFKETIKGSFIITLIFLCTLFILSNQRILLELFGESSDVGIFQFYYFIATGIPNLLEATLYSFLLPNLVFKNKDNLKGKIKRKVFLILNFHFLFNHNIFLYRFYYFFRRQTRIKRF
jgi:hypothetical protein